MRIVITGPKGSGKSTLGTRISESLNIPFFETDQYLEEMYYREKGERLHCRQIFRMAGEDGFRNWEKSAVKSLAEKDWCLIITGGGTMYDSELRKKLKNNSILILLKAADDLLWERIRRNGIPPFLEGDDGFGKYVKRNSKLYNAVEHIGDIVFTVTDENEDTAHIQIMEQISILLMLGMYSPSTFGEIIRTSTFGESHGPAVGAVLDGIKPGLEISEDDIQKELNRRRPGQSRVTTSRNEADKVHILSGIFEGKTTGAPICMVVYNRDQDSAKYDVLRDIFRPGHADFTFWKKYGIRDHRGGGRTSGRETVGRVAAGAVAKKILKEEGIEIIAFAEEIAGIKGKIEDYSFIEKNSVRAADPGKAADMEAAILDAREEGDSVGGIVKLIVSNVPEGLGDPVFFKLDARLSMALFSIGAVKGVEFGSGFESAGMKGSINNDQMEDGIFLANNAGGIIGGISTGMDIVARIAVKPTPSISKDQKTNDIDGNNRIISIAGRHDPCIVPRIIPVIESMVSLVIVDAMKINKQLNRI